MPTKQGPLWFGFLEAGTKGSPVVRDPALDTCRPSTVYLFNLNKSRILEYRRDIAEPKLRELTPKEQELVSVLREAYEHARTSFTPRTVEAPVPAVAPRKKRQEEEIEDLEIDDDIPVPDADLDEDDDLD